MRAWIVIAALSAAPLLRDTNSHAAATRGAKAYAASKYTEAAKAYAEAQQLAPSSRGAFNLGTAQIAAGDRERGSATLTEAMKDPSLAAEAHFNRGNSALAAKAFDHAIRDYIDTLKLKPDHAAAKRNLEIALARQQLQKQSGSSGNNSQPNQQGKQQQQTPDKNGKQQPKPGDIDLEQLLRSVQQQEQEELRRMKARAAEAKVGW
jgi:Ca-activated chloride channel family protein